MSDKLLLGEIERLKRLQAEAVAVSNRVQTILEEDAWRVRVSTEEVTRHRDELQVELGKFMAIMNFMIFKGDLSTTAIRVAADIEGREITKTMDFQKGRK